ncbi:MAG: alpha-2-macroglobulin [Dysgonamonadaceae bacterium]|nr:alpha-2-macroglobulin [Dysgonamonadaceae bacterium]
MKNTFKSPAVYILLAILCTVFSCGKKVTVPAPEFTSYISAYTGGLIESNSTIRIEFAGEQQEAKPLAEIKENLFSFKPSLRGKTQWIDRRTIEFVPEAGALKSGETYQAEFKMGKVVNVEDRLNIFPFSFKVEDKNFDIVPNALQIKDSQSVTASGEIRFSSEVDETVVKKGFSAITGDKQTLSPKIESTGNAKTYRFVIENIKRKDSKTKLTITFDGREFGAGKKQLEEIFIPAINDFEVIETEVISESEAGIRIVFSSPLSTGQDLRGLIQIPELTEYTVGVQDNRALIYFDRKNISKITVNVNEGLQDNYGRRLRSAYSTELNIEPLKPQVELLKSGNILPNSENLILPFKAVNLKAVDLKIIKIFENNVLMFLQTNQLNGNNELRRAGRLIHRETIRLDADLTKNIHDWQNYSVDLSKIIRQEPGAIYRIEFWFKQAYASYPCEDFTNTQAVDNKTKSFSSGMVRTSNTVADEDIAVWDVPYSYFDDSEYDWNTYNWNDRENPCKPTYYMLPERKAVCNVIQSNIGLTAKGSSDNKWWIAVTDLLDTKPIANAEITAYNFQLQPVATAKTDGDGFAVLAPKTKPFIVIASADKQKTYLRLVDGEENSMSRFDTDGEKIEKGLKGFIYGERGVWRPGDTLHISFILHDPEKRIPANHPVALELYNPRGQFNNKQIATEGLNGFYTFAVPTNANDPTGLWNVYVKAGGTTFHKPIRIETIKPNRLKINLSIPGQRIDASAGNVPVRLASSWLTGATAHNLKTKVEMTLTRTNTQFKGYEKYIFNNPASSFTYNESVVFDGTLNDVGEVQFNMKTPEAQNAPGMLNANIVCRVFEAGGDASIYTQGIPFSPFSSYVGLKLNADKNQSIETDTEHRFDVVTLDASGKLTNRADLEYKIYRIGWSWWWDENDYSYSNYVNNSSYLPVKEGTLKTVNGKAAFTFKLNYPEWGRYLIYIKDKASGHATGGTVYIDWPEWRGRAGRQDPKGVKMLSFSTDKSSYEVGENITVIIPASAGGRALVALENGSSVLDRKWINVSKKGDTKYTFKATKEMAPNFYIHISLLQPHAQTVNDLPIRLYGVMPVLISNKESVLTPQIGMPDILRPETKFTVEVSEKSGKAMTYTLAIVDDGLLDLTNFKTPNPWNKFYAREALGIRTWDMFDYVMGAFGGKFSSLFGVGGDEALKPGEAKANRFKPVVKFLGPFTLGKGEKKKHEITLPVYVGSVRTMVVAGQDGAFGMAEKTTPVRTPLMALSSLPRVLGVNEEISLPVNIFAMENSVKNATVKVETTGLLQLNDSNDKQVTFDKPGDKMVYFSMKTGAKPGVEKVTVTASGDGKISKETIEIEVRNPNPDLIFSDAKILNSGQTGEFAYRLTGASDNEWIKLEASRIPSVNIVRRYDYLFDYNHCCTEQLTSKALPLLYLSLFKDMDKKESETVKKNIQEAVKNLYERQLNNGGLVYWPGESHADEWITSYAGTFLALAKEKGYEVNEGVLSKWKNFQRSAAQNWKSSVSSSAYLQAFRLYSLALADATELGAMNRLKELKDIPLQARWSLAAAYAVSGKAKPAEELIFNQPTDVSPYYSRYTFGTSARDEALILQTLALMGRTQEAFKQAQKVASRMSEEMYYDTQSTAYALIALGALAEKMSGSIDFDWTLNGAKQKEIHSTKATCQIQFSKKPDEGSLSLTNKGKGDLYVTVIGKSRPVVDTFPAIARNIKLNVSYADLSGKELDASELRQGTDFMAVVGVINMSASTDYTDLALTHIIPSGWEIFNESAADDTYTYRDVRDDRVLTYFDLSRGKSKAFKIRLQASYLGAFALPAISCEAMYEAETQARTVAGTVRVVK